jgi:hypothetical protein
VKWLALAVVGVAILAWWIRRRPGEAVSAAWLDDRRRTEMGAGLDGVNWRWPIRPEDRADRWDT